MTRTAATGNTYQRRRLESGAEHEVLKNFPSPHGIRNAIVQAGGEAPVIEELQHLWCATYAVPGGR